MKEGKRSKEINSKLKAENDGQKKSKNQLKEHTTQLKEFKFGVEKDIMFLELQLAKTKEVLTDIEEKIEILNRELGVDLSISPKSIRLNKNFQFSNNNSSLAPLNYDTNSEINISHSSPTDPGHRSAVSQTTKHSTTKHRIRLPKKSMSRMSKNSTSLIRRISRNVSINSSQTMLDKLKLNVTENVNNKSELMDMAREHVRKYIGSNRRQSLQTKSLGFWYRTLWNGAKKNDDIVIGFILLEQQNDIELLSKYYYCESQSFQLVMGEVVNKVLKDNASDLPEILKQVQDKNSILKVSSTNLLKEGQLKKNKQNRFVMLFPDICVFFVKKCCNPIAVIPLETIRTINGPTGNKFELVVDLKSEHSKTFFLQTSTNEECNNWVKSFQLVIIEVNVSGLVFSGQFWKHPANILRQRDYLNPKSIIGNFPVDHLVITVYFKHHSEERWGISIHFPST